MASIRGIQVDYPDVEEINATAAKDPNLRSRLRDGFNDANRFHPKKMAAAKVAGKTALAAGATALIDAATPEDSALGAGAKTAVQAAAVHPLLAAPAGALSAMQTAANNQAKANGYGSGIEYGLAREQQQMQADTLRKSQNLQRVLPRANIPASMQEGANRASGLDANGQLPENALRASLRASDPYYRQPAAEPPQKAQAAPTPAPAPTTPPAPAPAPAPAPTPPSADPASSIRRSVDAQGRVTFSNNDTPLAAGNVSTVGIDKAAIELGIAADRDLHNARIEALDGRAPVEGGRVASLGGGETTGTDGSWRGPSAGLRDMAENSPRAKYRALAGQVLAQQENSAADRAAEMQRAQMQNAATLRGQDILRQNNTDDMNSRMAIAEMNAKATAASKAPTLKDQFETLKLAREQGYTQDKDGKWVHGGVDANGNQKIRTNEQVLADSRAAEELRLKEAEFNAGREKAWFDNARASGMSEPDIAAHQAVRQRTWNDFAARVDKTVKAGGVVSDPAIAQLMGVKVGDPVPLEDLQQRLMTANNGRASWANMPQDVENLLVPLAQQSVETQQNGVTQSRILRDALYGLGGAALGHFIRGRIPGGGLVAVPGVAAAGVGTSEVAGKMFDWDKFSPYSASSALQR